MQRLAGAEWFAARISCCGLLPTAFRIAHESEHEHLRGVFKALAEDDTPMVRRAAAQHLGGVAEAVDQRVVSQDISPIFLKLTQDGERSVTLHYSKP